MAGSGGGNPTGRRHLPDKANPALTKVLELYMGHGLPPAQQLAAPSLAGLIAGLVSPTQQRRGWSRGHRESPRDPFPMGGPTGGPQEVVGASVLCPGHGGSHMGTPGPPPQTRVQAMGAAGLGFPQML